MFVNPAFFAPPTPSSCQHTLVFRPNMTLPLLLIAILTFATVSFAADSHWDIMCSGPTGTPVLCTETAICQLLASYTTDQLVYSCQESMSDVDYSFESYPSLQACQDGSASDSTTFLGDYGRCMLSVFDDCAVTQTTDGICPPNPNPGCTALIDDINKANTCSQVNLWLTPADSSAPIHITGCPSTSLPQGTLQCKTDDGVLINNHPVCQFYKDALAACTTLTKEMCYDDSRTVTDVAQVAEKGECTTATTTWAILPANRCADAYIRARPICMTTHKTNFSQTNFVFGQSLSFQPQHNCLQPDTTTYTIAQFPATAIMSSCGFLFNPTSICIQWVDGVPVRDDTCAGLCKDTCLAQSNITTNDNIACYLAPKIQGANSNPKQFTAKASCSASTGITHTCCKQRCGLTEAALTGQVITDECSSTDYTKFNSPSDCGDNFSRFVGLVDASNAIVSVPCTPQTCDPAFLSPPPKTLPVTASTTPTLATLCPVEDRCPTGGNGAYESCACSKTTCFSRTCAVQVAAQGGGKVWVKTADWSNPDYSAAVTALCPNEQCPCPTFGCAITQPPTQSTDLDSSCTTDAGYTQTCNAQCSLDGKGDAIDPAKVTRDVYCVKGDGSLEEITTAAAFSASDNCPSISDQSTIDALFSKSCPQSVCAYTWLCNNDVSIASAVSTWPVATTVDDIESFLTNLDCTNNSFTPTCYTPSTVPQAVAPDDIVENTCPPTGSVTVVGSQYRRVGCFSYDSTTGQQIIMTAPVCSGNAPDTNIACGASTTGCFLTDVVIKIDGALFSINEASNEADFTITYTGDFVQFAVQAVDLDGVGDTINADDSSLTFVALGSKITLSDIDDNDQFTVSLSALTLTSSTHVFFRFVFDNSNVVYPAVNTAQDTTVRYLITHVPTCADLTCGGSEWQCQPHSITGSTATSAKCVCTDASAKPENQCVACPKECPTTKGITNAPICGCKSCQFGHSGTYCDNCDRFVALALANPPDETRTLLASVTDQSVELTTAQRAFLSSLESVVETQLNWAPDDFTTVRNQFKINSTHIVVVFAVSGTCPTPTPAQSSFLSLATTNPIASLHTAWNGVDMSDYIESEYPDATDFAISKSTVWDPLAVCTKQGSTTPYRCPQPDWFAASNLIDCAAFPSHPMCAEPAVTDPEEPEEPEDDDKAGATTIIIAIVVPIVAILIIVAVIVLLFCFCAQDRKRENESHKSPEGSDGPKHQKRKSTTEHLELI